MRSTQRNIRSKYEAKNPDEKMRIQRQIESTDSQIDKLVYELYNLTPEEVKLVEGKG